MGFKLYRVNRKINLDELYDILECKFVYSKMLKELDDPFVLNMYLLGEEEVCRRSYSTVLSVVEQITNKINYYCSKYKLNSLDELEFESLTNYSKDINKSLSYGMYCMMKYSRLHSMPNFIKYLPQDKLEQLGLLAMDAIKDSQNLTYMPQSAYSILDEVSNIKSKLNSVWDNLIVLWEDSDVCKLFRLDCVSPDELGLSLSS